MSIFLVSLYVCKESYFSVAHGQHLGRGTKHGFGWMESMNCLREVLLHAADPNLVVEMVWSNPYLALGRYWVISHCDSVFCLGRCSNLTLLLLEATPTRVQRLYVVTRHLGCKSVVLLKNLLVYSWFAAKKLAVRRSPSGCVLWQVLKLGFSKRRYMDLLGGLSPTSALLRMLYRRASEKVIWLAQEVLEL